MKINRRQLEKLNEINRFIIEKSYYFSDYEEDIIFTEERIQEILEEEEDIPTINYTFPGYDEVGELPIGNILDLSDEILSIEIINNGLIKTKNRRYYIVDAYEEYHGQLIRELHSATEMGVGNISICLIDESFIVGLAATILEEYDSHYWNTYSQYLSIEVIYENSSTKLSTKEEKNLIASFLFEIADTTGIALSFSEIRCPTEYDYSDLRDEHEENHSELRELIQFNPAMDLFTSATQIRDPKMKFLNFYKILEHFSPIAVNIEAMELMRIKLDSGRKINKDGDYIKSIFDLANSMRDKKNDEDLIKSSLLTCVDIIGLHELLPPEILKKLNGHLKNKKIDYSVDINTKTTICNMIGKIIYKYRNSVVHAKSNFKSDNELEIIDIEALNTFMKEASSQSIRWYSRLPNHQKRTVVE